MADIFISYSKADRDLVVKLAAFLEAEGWSVWWDSSLKPADAYRDEIMRELTHARAVICVWTENSIKSDWVRAEAGRAKADGKLIPVKSAGVEYKDIPLPFGEMHTEPFSNTELIRAAVVAQLEKPAVNLPTWSVALKQIRYSILSWLGIIGGGLSLFVNFQAIVSLAQWAHWLVSEWVSLTSWFWRKLLAWSGLSIAPHEAVFLTLFASLFGIMLGSRFYEKGGRKDVSLECYRSRSLAHVAISLIGTTLLFFLLVLMVVGAIADIGDALMPSKHASNPSLPMLAFVAILVVAMNFLVTYILVSSVGIATYVLFAYTFCISIIIFVMGVVPFLTKGNDELAYAFLVFIIMPVSQVVMLYFAPLIALTGRVSFLIFTLLLLLTLNELSKFELSAMPS